MTLLTIPDVMCAAKQALSRLPVKRSTLYLYGVPRGGIPAALAIQAEYIAERRSACWLTENPESADVIVDDLIDSGATRDYYAKLYPGKPFVALFEKKPEDDWLIFPWEQDATGSAEDIPRRLLQFIGEDPTRGGLRETPERFLKAWQHYTKGYHESPSDVLKVFEDGAENMDEIVLVRDIPVYSHCEHHLAPFFGIAHVGYIPDGRVVGLSKLVRLVDIFARRLQVQERLTTQIANALQQSLNCRGVGVILECRHLCMEARGVRAAGTTTKTSCMLGLLREQASARAEFLALVR